MKKIIYCLSFIAASLLLFSCKSSEEVAAAKKAEEEKRIAAEKAEEAKKKAEKNFLGWVGGTVKNPSAEDGLVKIKVDSNLGTFCIYVVDSQNREYAIFSTLNEFSSTGFSLKAGKKVYRLISDKKIKASAGETSDGVSLLYSVKDVADVCIKMNIFQSIVNKPADTIKFTVSVKNRGKKADSFAIKAILDTVLGEKNAYHFYTSEYAPVRGEISSRKMQNEKWFVSKNDRASMQILVDGGDTTPVDLFTLANYSTLENYEWEPNVHSFRAFDTVLSYNNSAMGIFWPSMRLDPEETYDLTFYISVALDGLTPNGYKYVYGIKPVEKPVEKEIINLPNYPAYPVYEEEEPVVIYPVKGEPYVEEITDEPEVEEVLNEPVIEQIEDKSPDEEIFPVIESYINTDESAQTPIEKKKDDVEVIESNSGNSGEEKELPNIEFNVDTIDKDHLTPEYVQNLIDRINELDKSENPDRNEILQLGKELDAILSIIGQN